MESTQRLSFPSIKVFGFGGCGSNTISNLIGRLPEQVELIASNSDAFSLSRTKANKKILLGEKVCKGLGAGGDVNLGRLAAEECFRQLIKAMKGAGLILLTAGLGGGTGSGAIEIAARIAASLNIPTISFASLPFSFESEDRQLKAYEAASALQPFTNTLITIPNDTLLTIPETNLPLNEALRLSDSLLINFLESLIDLVSFNDTMHIDLSYILNAFKTAQGVYLAKGEAAGTNRVYQALEEAMDNPILERKQIQNASRALIKFSGHIDSDDIESAFDFMKEKISRELDITPIISSPVGKDGKLSVSIMLTGIGAMPVSYPESWAVHPSDLTAESADVNEFGISSSEEPVYADVLEVPAFIRRGYNLKRSGNHDKPG